MSLIELVDNTRIDKNTTHLYLDLYQNLLQNKKENAKKRIRSRNISWWKY